MRSDYAKLIFYIVAVCLVIISVWLVYFSDNDKTSKTNPDGEEIEFDANITIGITGYDTIDPLLSKSQDVQYINKLIFNSLIEIDERYEAKNKLAEEISRMDNKTYLVKLKEGVMWHDGERFTAHDVKYTIEKIKDLGEKSIYIGQVKDIQGVEIISDNIIKIILDDEMGYFSYMLNFPVVSEQNYEREGGNIVGTGDHRITKMSEQNINIERVNGDVGNNVKQIDVKIYESISDMYSAFSKGQVDVINTSNDDYSRYIGTIGYNANSCSGREFEYLIFNTKTVSLEKRQAIQRSININEINYVAYENRHNFAYFPLGMVNYLYTGKEESMTKLSPNEDILKQLKTNRIKLKLVVNSSQKARVEVAKIIKSQLMEIGIKVNIVEVNREYIDKYIERNGYDMILTGNIVPIEPNLETYLGKDNWSKYINEDILNSLSLMANNDSGEIVKENYKNVVELYQQDIPFLSLLFNNNYILYRDNIHGNMGHTWESAFLNINSWCKIKQKN